MVEHEGELEDVTFIPDAPNGITRVGSNLPGEFKAQLRNFLIKNWDVFAWMHEDMPRINPHVAVHKLEVDSTSKPVKQKKINFALERNQAIA